MTSACRSTAPKAADVKTLDGQTGESSFRIWAQDDHVFAIKCAGNSELGNPKYDLTDILAENKRNESCRLFLLNPKNLFQLEASVEALTNQYMGDVRGALRAIGNLLGDLERGIIAAAKTDESKLLAEKLAEVNGEVKTLAEDTSNSVSPVPFKKISWKLALLDSSRLAMILLRKENHFSLSEYPNIANKIATLLNQNGENALILGEVLAPAKMPLMATLNVPNTDPEAFIAALDAALPYTSKQADETKLGEFGSCKKRDIVSGEYKEVYTVNASEFRFYWLAPRGDGTSLVGDTVTLSGERSLRTNTISPDAEKNADVLNSCTEVRKYDSVFSTVIAHLDRIQELRKMLKTFAGMQGKPGLALNHGSDVMLVDQYRIICSRYTIPSEIANSKSGQNFIGQLTSVPALDFENAYANYCFK
jgi:hypothetical protein